MAYSSRTNRGNSEDKKPTRYYSGRQEKKVARTLRGKQVTNSGAALFCSGDVKTDKFVIECKTTIKERNSFSIKKEWINKAKEEAFAMGRKHWSICFEYEPDATERFYVISEKDFNLLNKYMEDSEE